MTESESQEVIAAPASGLATKLRESAAAIDKLVYPAALLGSLSIWFIALRAPLWLDETLSHWQVSGGFAKVWTRSALMPSSIGYLYTLWFAKSILGSSEIALKIPSLIALLAAVYVLFRTARELYGEETAFLASILFCLEGNVVFAATDARPYAFALLATTIATLAFIRWMTQPDLRRAIWFGATAAGILYFHYLFGSILPAYAIYYLVVRGRSIREDARQLVGILASFAVLTVPLAVRVASLYHSRGTHIVLGPRHPILSALNTLAPKPLLVGFLLTAFLAALVRKIRLPDRENFPAILLGPLLALVPAAVFFGLSAATPLHLVIPRYFSVVAPGAALTWALLVKGIDSRVLRKIFCAGLVASTMFVYYGSQGGWHETSFKQAHALANAILEKEQVQVLENSAFIESNYEPLPTDRNSENALISQMYYYPVHSPFVMLPITLNEQTVQLGSQVVSEATRRRQRFLLVSTLTSYETVEWLVSYTRGSYTAKVIGRFDDALVVEFTPILWAAPGTP